MTTPPLYINVETIAGDDTPEDAIRELCSLASKIGVWVSSNVNGYSAFIPPDADPNDEVFRFGKWVQKRKI